MQCIEEGETVVSVWFVWHLCDCTSAVAEETVRNSSVKTTEALRADQYQQKQCCRSVILPTVEREEQEMQLMCSCCQARASGAPSTRDLSSFTPLERDARKYKARYLTRHIAS